MLKTSWCILFIAAFLWGSAQEESNTEFKYKGQLSSYAHLNPSNFQPFWLGGRYLPQGNLNVELKEHQLLDFEVSLNAYGNLAFDEAAKTYDSGDLKPYRFWARYSGPQFELRAGLQKINFGSANAIRPLMWFDQIDPRDPLKLTDGVWAVLGRYYFLNNANVWLWGILGSEETKGWEVMPSVKNQPEIGGRMQFPYSIGEIGLSYHHRKVADLAYSETAQNVPESRFGIDIRMDWMIGLWMEGSNVSKSEEAGNLTNQTFLNIGGDYTFGIGSGLYFSLEHLIMAYDNDPFVFENPVGFSVATASYPIGLFDNLSAILYYDWRNNNAYNFINYQKQLNTISLHFIGYWNPENYQIPTQTNSSNLFGGKGLQVMFVWNH